LGSHALSQIYRLSNYITVIVLSAACMALSSGTHAGLPPGHLLLFYGRAVLMQ
jgi:hypothetical protein